LPIKKDILLLFLPVTFATASRTKKYSTTNRNNKGALIGL